MDTQTQTTYTQTKTKTPLPKIGSPATRALANIGIYYLEDLAKLSEKELLNLHGMGPKALGILKEHLKLQGLKFLPNGS